LELAPRDHAAFAENRAAAHSISKEEGPVSQCCALFIPDPGFSTPSRRRVQPAMMTDRRKKLALAAAILLVGAGAALYFRIDRSGEATGSSSATIGPKLPVNDPPGGGTSDVQEPKLAGHIEPYTAQKAPSETPSASQLDTPAALGTAGTRPLTGVSTASPEAHLLKGPPLATPVDASAMSASSLAAPSLAAPSLAAPSLTAPSLAAPSLAAEPGGSALKWQTVRRPADAVSMSIDEALRADDHRQAAVAATPARRHKIVDGDTLARLAHRYLGTETRSIDLFEYNRDVLATPELLPIGKELRIPPAGYVRPMPPADESSASPPASRLSPVSTPVTAAYPSPSLNRSVPAASPAALFAPNQTYVVQPHDTLPLIARRLYGDLGRQNEILSANRQQLRSPADLRAGMTLFVPARTDERR
jgi:nucleoid-associated protein YgaU